MPEGRDSFLQLKATWLILIIFGSLQLLLFFQAYSNSEYTQAPAQCNCKCSRNLRIGAGQLTQKIKDAITPSQVIEDVANKHHNISWKQKLYEEDAKMDKDWHEKNKNKSVIEDPDEGEPYQKEVLAPASSANITKPDIPMYSPLTQNPEIDDRKSRCEGDHSNMLLFYVYSAPGNFNERRRIRTTWGSVKAVYDKVVRVVFFVGKLSTKNQKHYFKLKNESGKYQDIVHDLSYVDAYRNLTLKGISAMQWIIKYCPRPHMVVKVDDDTLVNPFQMTKFLAGQTEETMSEIICRWSPHAHPIRNYRSKYHVSVKEYDKDSYPPYCQGYGYILPPKTIPLLLENIHTRKLITMEDVYFTGLVREVIDVKIHALTAAFVTQSDRFEIILERITSRLELILIGHVHDDRLAEVYWKLIKQREEEQRESETQPTMGG